MNNTEFSKSLFTNINSTSYYPIKRSFGHTLQTCDINAVIAYAKIAQNNELYKITERNVEFIVSGLCYNVHKQYQDGERHYTRYEDVLKRLYISGTDSTKKSIENFLKLKFDDGIYFSKKFASLSKKLIALLYPNETFDFIKLLHDLKYWDYNNDIKLKWATALVISKTDKKESEEN